MKNIIIISGTILLLSSCTDATISQYGGLGDPHKIEMYSGGVKVKEWISTGKAMSTESSDGYYFRDSQCQCNVEVSGDVVITRLDK